MNAYIEYSEEETVSIESKCDVFVKNRISFDFGC